MGHECVDFGTDDRNPVDYPDIAYMAARALVEARVDRAILVCGTGIGMPMGAQRVSVLWMVLRETLVLLIAGLALGIPVLLVGGRLVTSLL
jgi:hypothetical protein